MPVILKFVHKSLCNELLDHIPVRAGLFKHVLDRLFSHGMNRRCVEDILLNVRIGCERIPLVFGKEFDMANTPTEFFMSFNSCRYGWQLHPVLSRWTGRSEDVGSRRVQALEESFMPRTNMVSVAK